MPRKKRIIVPGEIHHIMSRGIDGIEIFKDDRDSMVFISLFGKILDKSGCLCYAWALMPNHYHLLLRPLNKELSTIMRRLNGSYAKYFNKRCKRKGYLFQDRFKSIATQEYWYFKELIRYIHLNPIRSGLISGLQKLDSYQWSGHRAIIGKSSYPWFSSQNVLSRFGKSKKKAIEKYYQFLRDGLDKKYSSSIIKTVQDLKGQMGDIQDERVLGDTEFIRDALEKERKAEKNKNLSIKNRPSLETLASQTANQFNIEKNELSLKGRKNIRSKARSNFCKTAYSKYGYSINDIALFLGIHPSNIIRVIN